MSEEKEPIRMRGPLLQRIHGWLNHVRLSEGGRAKITDDDVDELYDIIDGLIHLKCQKDPDGDLPIEFGLIDRTKFEPMHFRPVLYDFDVGTLEERFQILMGHWSNLSVATGRFDTAMRCYEAACRRSREKNND